MRILQFGKSYPPSLGGVQKVIFDITVGLNLAGTQCDVLCCNDDKKFQVESLGQYSITRCKSWGKLAGTYISPQLVVQLFKQNRKYDVIHVHHPEPMATLALWLVRPKIPIVVHWHSDIVKQRIALLFFKLFQNWLLNRADRIIATSPKYASESSHLSKFQHKVTPIPIGIVESDLTPDKTKCDALKASYNSKFVIFSLGRLVYYKGFEYLIESAKSLDNDFLILIGGTGPLHGKLEQLIQSHQLQNKVKLLGYLTDLEIANYFYSCDVFCLPSIEKTEAFGIVQIEAMSFSKPVISTEIPYSGVSWVNQHNESGIIVPPKNIEKLTEAIQILKIDKELYSNFALGARKRFELCFKREIMISEIIKVYRSLSN